MFETKIADPDWQYRKRNFKAKCPHDKTRGKSRR